MNKILYLIIFLLFLTNSSYSEEANSHGGALELPESARPNDATISLFEKRKKLFIERRRREGRLYTCLLYTSPSPRDPKTSRMPSSA